MPQENKSTLAPSFCSVQAVNALGDAHHVAWVRATCFSLPIQMPISSCDTSQNPPRGAAVLADGHP